MANLSDDIVARLGTVYDSVIAAETGLSRRRVASIRNELGIPAFGKFTRSVDVPEKVLEQLGTMPDAQLAEISGVSEEVIRARRHERGIASYAEQTGNDGKYSSVDLVGTRSGKLVALEPTDQRCNSGYVIWRVRCDCGRVVERPSYIMRRGLIKSCGCGPTGRPAIPNNGAHVNSLYSNYRRSARERGHAFDLTKVQARALFEGDCYYCGEPPSVTYTHDNLAGEYAWNGIDRKDNDRGYTVDNCVSCCATCNFAKGVRSHSEFVAWIKRVCEHLS